MDVKNRIERITIKGKVRDTREILRKIEKRIRLKIFSNSPSIRKIDEVAITPTMKCSLNCAMCHQKQIKCWKDMDYETFKKVLINLKKAGVTKVSLVGGEIFVHKDMWKFIDLMEKMGFKYDLSSNLFFVPGIEKFKNLKGLEMVTTSIDGDDKLHDKIRGVKGAFKRTTKNIKKLLGDRIFVDVACVVQKANFNKLEKIVELICKMGVKKVSLLIENSLTEEEKECTRKLMRWLVGRKTEIIISSVKNPLGELTEEDYKKIPKKMATIQRITEKYGVNLGTSIQLKKPEILNKNYKLADYTCGLFGGYGSTVQNDSSFHQCCFMKILGKKNLKNSDPLSIVNSPEYKRFRKGFKEFGALEICRFCCALKLK